ncbi:SPL family radical SAM protein [Chitinivibrio alkaliphilus]|uniref:DNA repair photolyase SplB-like protein n=1 Tax=Chitinivibrio alkaliphilus ACht1 TaxID=1313304 RepID=U7D7A9_9BACT|nr:radical SAM protein [Chitinivibrio alkaliphilus]ERP31456.1 DNA repair photolyase SplB-like protein [Chitinivibrio alkaliphilus ACht1]
MLEDIQNLPLWKSLNTEVRQFCLFVTDTYEFTFQQKRQLLIWSVDLQMWGCTITPLKNMLEWNDKATRKQNARAAVSCIHTFWKSKKNEGPFYSGEGFAPSDISPRVRREDRRRKILGECPVASEKTRCCNLKTLDAVQGCGYGCSYCSIQSFYSGGEVVFDSRLSERLKELSLEKDRIYHIGTGQSSDSLMWGNTNNHLADLMHFADTHEQVILELKTKSNRVDWLLEHEIPRNVICTWSLNPQDVISAEEHHTASLQDRLDAAEKVARAGIRVGFHFHPMMRYHGWKEGYGTICRILQERFSPTEVVSISFGALTFIKPVLKKLRQRALPSRVLQMPFEEIAGRFSYPREIKKELFSYAYNCFSPGWKESVFFYLCMEDATLWKEVFGFEYSSNEALEASMNQWYMRKISEK